MPLSDRHEVCRLTRYLLLLLALACMSCAEKSAAPEVSRNTTPAEITFPLPPRQDVAPVIRSVEDVLLLERCIKLEVTPESLVADVSDVQRIEQTWFVLDQRQNMVLMFGEDGSFQGRLGRGGQGPGEYVQAHGLTVMGTLLVVLDSMRGALMFYNRDGSFVEEQLLRHYRVFTSGPFVFHEDRVYIANFWSETQAAPNHLIMNTHVRPWQVGYGFGTRFPLLYDAQGKRRREIQSSHFTAFERVGDRLWVGSPNSSVVEVYDLEGRFLAELHPGLDGLVLDDYDGITQEHQRLKIKYSKFATHRIWHLNPYVLVLYTHARAGRMSIFDNHGHMIKANLAPHVFLHYGAARVVGERLVTPLPLSDLTDKGLSRFSAEERAVIDASGFDPANAENDNPYLLISGRKE